MSGLDFSEAEVEEFKIEANDLLDQGEAALMELDKGGNFKTLYNSIFRVFHSIKGGAGMLSLNALQDHMHKVESIFSDAKNSDALNKDQISFFLKGVDAARKIMSGESVTFDYAATGAEKGDKPLTQTAPKTETPAATASAAPTPSTKKLSPFHVYAIDDEPEILEILKSLLVDAGLLCTTFEKADELYAAVQKQRPEVVLSDMKMPKVSGVDVLKKIKSIDPDLPVLFLSGYLTKDILIESLEEGVAGAIEKPFNESNLINMVTNSARQYRMIRLLNQSINLILYQLSDLEDFLKANNKEDVSATIRRDFEMIVSQRRMLREIKKSAN